MWGGMETRNDRIVQQDKRTNILLRSRKHLSDLDLSMSMGHNSYTYAEDDKALKPWLSYASFPSSSALPP